MNEIRLAWAAFKNMLRTAARDPVWAVTALCFAPFRAFLPLVQAIALLFIVAIVFGMGGGMLLSISDYTDNIAIGSLWFSIVAIVLITLAFRLLTNPLITHFGDLHGETHGSARFTTSKELKELTKDNSGLMIGRHPETKKIIRYDGPAHLFTMAPTRSGKGVGSILPNLLSADRSIICIDPKGENARVATHARQSFGPVHVLDPFGVTGQPSAAFNPLDALDPHSLDVAEDASTLADALVVDDPGSTGDAHWNEEARALIAGLILYIVAQEPRDRRTLATLRDYLTLAPHAFAKLLADMQAIKDTGGLIARAANRHLGKADKEAASVLSSAQRHTHFLDSPRMSTVLGRSDFRFADLKTRTGTVFLVLPPDRLSTYSRWLRLLITQSLLDMARTPTSPVTPLATPVLYLLDEFAALGHLAAVERAMGLMAGYGVQLWPILQDLHQLRATYGQRAGTFLSNAGVLQLFGVNDNETAKFVSDMLGQQTVVFRTMAQALDSEKSGISFGEQHSARPLMTPDEVRNFPQNGELLFIAGKRPIMANKLVYYADREFQGLFDPA